MLIDVRGFPFSPFQYRKNCQGVSSEINEGGLCIGVDSMHFNLRVIRFFCWYIFYGGRSFAKLINDFLALSVWRFGICFYFWHKYVGVCVDFCFRLRCGFDAIKIWNVLDVNSSDIWNVPFLIMYKAFLRRRQWKKRNAYRFLFVITAFVKFSWSNTRKFHFIPRYTNFFNTSTSG